MTNDEQTQRLVEAAAGPFKKEGEAIINDQTISLPLGYNGPRKIDPMNYKMLEIQDSEEDYFPDLEGDCKVGKIIMTERKIQVQIAFKEKGEASPYKIIL